MTHKLATFPKINTIQLYPWSSPGLLALLTNLSSLKEFLPPGSLAGR